ncbi:hypothetical protein [Rachiplusia nu nucleopolyhedrovirus]|uniref:Uncharacterized protein n=1 Tax=Rachiplusia nu nucleopolyhedrovirus TaxID=2605775 RepID=A0AAE6M6K5_9ABAC|nr:hypothetical protein QKQ55_gp115 [Rachiplusia nu nucleopolyhedrovirus]QEI03697.1 hypothetical protein [Rachiplusia nu nucleopolyhedrovirus]
MCSTWNENNKYFAAGLFSTTLVNDLTVIVHGTETVVDAFDTADFNRIQFVQILFKELYMFAQRPTDMSYINKYIDWEPTNPSSYLMPRNEYNVGKCLWKLLKQPFIYGIDSLEHNDCILEHQTESSQIIYNLEGEEDEENILTYGLLKITLRVDMNINRHYYPSNIYYPHDVFKKPVYTHYMFNVDRSVYFV